MRENAGSGNRHKPLAALLGVVLGATLLVWALPSAASPPAEQPATGAKHGDANHGGATKTHGNKHDAKGAHGTHKPAPINWTSFDYKGKGSKWTSAPFLFTLINFALLVYLLVRFTRKPLGGYLAERYEKIKTDLDEAARLREEAAKKLAEVDGRLANLDKEIGELKAAVAEDAELERQRIIENAEKEAEALVGASERTLQVELERAKRQLEVSAIQAALQAAEKLLKKEVGEQDARRMHEEYFAQIEDPQIKQVGGGN